MQFANGHYANFHIVIVLLLNSLALMSCSKEGTPASAPQGAPASTPQKNASGDALKWDHKQEYRWNGEKPCQADGGPAVANEICISKADYVTACKQARSISRSAQRLALVMGSPVQMALASGGALDDFSIEWYDRNEICFVRMELSGVYQGTSSRATIVGYANRFRLDDKGGIVVTGVVAR